MKSKSRTQSDSNYLLKLVKINLKKNSDEESFGVEPDSRLRRLSSSAEDRDSRQTEEKSEVDQRKRRNDQRCKKVNKVVSFLFTFFYVFRHVKLLKGCYLNK